MKTKNSKIILIIGTFLGVYILLAGYLSLLNKSSVKTNDIEIENKEISFEINNIENEIVKPQIETIPQTKPLSDVESIDNQIEVSLIVLDKKYELEVKDNSSVFDAMKELQIKTNGGFSFKYNEYPSMGVFVYEINGMKEKSGSYWIYYVNEKEASVGVSNYVLKEGDSILWKQE